MNIALSPDQVACLGVFDSGVGGLTVLRELRRQLPAVPLRYVADTAHAPYGQRSSAFITERSLAIGQHLIDHGARLLVVACNTATAHAIHAMRQRWPGLPIVGTEPGIKPAVAASHGGRIGVLATPATIASARYQALLARHAGAAQIFSQPCPGLADLIETGELESAALRELLATLCAPLRAAGVDTVLMGCTHYPLIQPLLEAELGPTVQLLNIEAAVAQQAARLWAGLDLPAAAGRLDLETSGDPEELTRFVQRALGWQDVGAERLTMVPRTGLEPV
ncbi:glutamate racemase [Roseateles violae]|uniref:Glutamate racemase n=1 Tax=Roseateles violae TaxID=3058042 RepID=A0ABT8DZH5_9BURK|nr:glutamate racemase [Pelomonas sp. PFR6]MDN3922998.1 glutamate racemase [Pelomonas sp. PFR6]